MVVLTFVLTDLLVSLFISLSIDLFTYIYFTHEFNKLS